MRVPHVRLGRSVGRRPRRARETPKGHLRAPGGRPKGVLAGVVRRVPVPKVLRRALTRRRPDLVPASPRGTPASADRGPDQARAGQDNGRAALDEPRHDLLAGLAPGHAGDLAFRRGVDRRAAWGADVSASSAATASRRRSAPTAPGAAQSTSAGGFRGGPARGGTNRAPSDGGGGGGGGERRRTI